MRALLRSSVLAAGFATVACNTATPPSPAQPGAVEAPTKAAASPATSGDTAKKQFGAAITESVETKLAAITSDPAKFGGKTVRTQGVVTAVCKNMGCWMEIGDENGLAHIQMAGHAFFVPRDCNGRKAVVQGKVLAEAAPGCGDDCRADNKKAVGGKVAKIEIEATGVELID